MRLRRSSIRAKIIALLMLPILALTGLWVYATLVTTGDVRSQLSVVSAYRSFGGAADQYARDVQAERRAAVLMLAAPGSTTLTAAYRRAQGVTDQGLAALRAKADGPEAGKLDDVQRKRLQGVLTGADQLGPIRGQVARGANLWAYVIDQYSALIDPVFSFRSAFVSRQSGQLPRQGTILTELVRAREYLSREDAAMEGLRLTDQPDASMVQEALDGLHNQRALFDVYIDELDPQDQGGYRRLRTGNNWMALASMEAFFEDSPDHVQAVKGLSDNSWRDAADGALSSLADLDTRLDATLDERARSAAIHQLVRGGIAGVVGLVAVVLSIAISYRIGRGLAYELITLRNAAQELAGTRLPSVMLRLRKGETVDVAAEAPAIDLGPAEIGQVGRAFNAVQRAAVEAAVEQAELRRGVAAVFVNLARRSQVLLHRQLTLLDTMERRAENPTELEDLFRLDHMTTRMRRHAEGLIILAGGSPGRAWRKPVRMVDVVRAAVSEVEDYARVVVRPFPGTGLLGSTVADVAHLIAELVENATVYSPPNTQVTVQGEVVAHGFCLEIDDRGLGLGEQALAEINQRLSEEQEFDLADTDRLGLFVVSRLARRHGIRVHLRPSPYGGTSAVVLIPRELLAEAPESANTGARGAAAGAGGAVSRTGARPVGARRGQRELVAVPALPEEGVPAPAGDGGRRRGTSARAESDAPVRVVERPSGGPRPSAPESTRTPGGLPRRRAATANSAGPALVPADAPRGEGGAAVVTAGTDADPAGDPAADTAGGTAPEPAGRAGSAATAASSAPAADAGAGSDGGPGAESDGGPGAGPNAGTGRHRRPDSPVEEDLAEGESGVRAAPPAHAAPPRAEADAVPSAGADPAPSAPSAPSASSVSSAPSAHDDAAAPAAPGRESTGPGSRSSAQGDPDLAAGGLLPRRVRQASLAPQLKAAAAAAAAVVAGEEGPGTREPESVRERSPEEARSTFASFQRGYQRGRGDRPQPASLTVVPDPPAAVASHGADGPADRPAGAEGPADRPAGLVGSSPEPVGSPSGSAGSPPDPVGSPSGSAGPTQPSAGRSASSLLSQSAPAVPPAPAVQPAPFAPQAQPAPTEGTES
ncbi:nitrate- and nitrite sensing domain-containing protein [Kitasatospora sp. HPMI-4]|uniref:sensor histidine kinase n=1 Tax=Kitasatospora sp. HPMI-4 TaxID=3448443 RepID=UPI003F1D7051